MRARGRCLCAIFWGSGFYLARGAAGRRDGDDGARLVRDKGNTLRSVVREKCGATGGASRRESRGAAAAGGEELGRARAFVAADDNASQHTPAPSLPPVRLGCDLASVSGRALLCMKGRVGVWREREGGGQRLPHLSLRATLFSLQDALPTLMEYARAILVAHVNSQQARERGRP